jgi:hypothetical protein
MDASPIDNSAIAESSDFMVVYVVLIGPAYVS